jgi:hypothetical protein
MLHPARGSSEVTPSSDGEAPSNIAAHCAQEGIKVDNKRRKQRLQGTMTMTSHNDGQGWGGGWFRREAHFDYCSERQASSGAAHRPLQEASRGGLPKPHIPCEEQAQGLRHD